MNLWNLLTTEGKKYLRDAMPGGALNPEITPQGLLDVASIATAPVPVVGDVLGLTADAKRMYDNPEERTAANVGLAGLGLLPFVPSVGTIKGVAPQAEALETARKNAVKMLGLPPNNTPMDRARAMGVDTDVFHANGADFDAFKPNSYRGAISVAATPEGAMRGALAGAADGTGTGATHIMPLMMRSDGVQGLRLPQDQVNFMRSLPKEATEAQVDELMKNAPSGSYWGNFFQEIEKPDGSFAYVRKAEPKITFEQAQKTKRGADGMAFPNWGDERWSADRQKQIGGKGWLQADEAGISASIVDPSILRSRFAAFDPARINENDLLGRADPKLLGLLGLLGAGGVGAARYMNSEEK